MKENLFKGLILMCICVCCALAISVVNTITSPIIVQNQIEKEAKLCRKIFVEFDEAKDQTTEGFENDKIVKRVKAEDASDNVLGYIYTVSGKNSYGIITLLVGIDNNGNLVSVQFMENGQSFSSETVNHVNTSYFDGMVLEDVNNVDTVCGATYAAKLVKELVTIAFEDYNSLEVA